MKTLRYWLITLTALIAALGLPTTALACGGLLAPNGAVRLERATTLVAYHAGIEHYLTSFSYRGDTENLGWFVPLPANPEKIELGGGWTLQRLNREFHPIQTPTSGAVLSATKAEDSATVLQTAKIDALNLTVLQGSGQAVINWAAQNNFLVDPETAAHIMIYAKGSPYFMAAKYDTSAAHAKQQLTGDGTPVLMTLRIDHPWVPLEVLGIGGQIVHADLFFITDQRLDVSAANLILGQSPIGASIPGTTGFTIAGQQRMSDSLYRDLSTDRNMTWVPQDSWVTYMTLDAPAPQISYDLGITSAGLIRVAPYGTAPMAIATANVQSDPPSWAPHFPVGTPQIALFVTILLLLTGSLWYLLTRQTRIKAKAINADQQDE